MTESRESPIFISYSRQDHAYVERLIAAFEERGLPVWLDNRIDYGTAWQHEIEKHLEACKAFVLVMTPRANESHWVKCELSFALELKKPIFPLLLEGRRWFSVAAIQTVDVTDGTLPPKRFFDAVGASVIKVDMPPEAKSSNVASTVSISTRDEVNAGFVEDVVEIDLAALREVAAQKIWQISQPAEQLLSVDARYADLERYLKNGQWKKADSETYRLMITEVGKEEGQWFDREDLLNFPCEPLKAIDGLWVKHSGGKFGFSVQKEMYLECGGIPDGKYYEEVWRKLCQMNGWDGSINFDLGSPRGHLPFSPSSQVGLGKDCYLFSRIQTCKL